MTRRGRRCTTPGAVIDDETGQLISHAEVAETTFTAFASTKRPVAARLVVGRVRDHELFPVWRHHPCFTDSQEPTAAADITHRRHAVVETVFADLIDGPLAHLPSGRFAPNHAWALCAAITHNLLRAADTLDPTTPAVARGATLRPQIVHVPARLTRPDAARSCTCPSAGHGPPSGWRCETRSSTTTTPTRPRQPPETIHRRQAQPGDPAEELGRPAATPCLRQATPRVHVMRPGLPRIQAKTV